MHSLLEQPSLRDQVIPLSLEAYHALGEMGFIEEKSELIHGFILAKMPKSPRHRTICQRLIDALRAAAGLELSVWQEQPITCRDSEPEPDVAVVRGTLAEFASRHPTTAALVIEVSMSTLERDLEKASIYAGAGVEEYWIIRPDELVADIYTLPGIGGYGAVRRVGMADALSPAILPTLVIRMEELLA